jgi:threonine/homoserine/homoserine lactone efflux protein
MDALSSWLVIFSLSFAAALSGALSPGPFLVYTITKSIQDHKRGYLVGFLVIIGHALLELCIMLLIMFGLSFVLQNRTVISVISIAGCGFLLFFGITLIIDVARGKVDTGFLEKAAHQTQTVPAGKKKALDNPVIGGILVSMSNPYWWIWWASIGSIFMARYQIVPTDLPKMTAFYTGHEAGDLIWYVPVSIMAYLGRSRLNKKIYSFILILCGAFMALFGVYMEVSYFWRG